MTSPGGMRRVREGAPTMSAVSAEVAAGDSELTAAAGPRPTTARSALLSSEQVAEFITKGFLRFDAIVPEEINAVALGELKSPGVERVVSPFDPEPHLAGTRLSAHFATTPGLRAFLDLPSVQGIIESLVGPDPVYDHHAVHVRRPGTPSQLLHADGIVDLRAAFDIELMYYPQAVTALGGGTMVVPGSHLRKIQLSDIARYQNLAGQEYLECPRGSMLVIHQGLWHCGRRNRTDNVRHMFKIRLNPRVEQVRLWDTSDLDDPAVRKRIRELFYSREPWFEGASGHLEQVQRTALFRRMSGDLAFDEVEARLARLENRSSPLLRELLP
jgi:Phytanoyl-CoA dioxygenase (PhyH)